MTSKISENNNRQYGDMECAIVSQQTPYSSEKYTAINNQKIIIHLDKLSKSELDRKSICISGGGWSTSLDFGKQFRSLSGTRIANLESALEDRSIYAKIGEGLSDKYKKTFNEYCLVYKSAVNSMHEEMQLPPTVSPPNFQNLYPMRNMPKYSVVIARPSHSKETDDRKNNDSLEQEKFPVDFMLIAAHSSVVKDMLTLPMPTLESENEEIVLELDGSNDTIEKVVKFMYGIPIEYDNDKEAFTINQFADKFLINDLAAHSKAKANQHRLSFCDPKNLTSAEDFDREVTVLSWKEEAMIPFYKEQVSKVNKLYVDYLQPLFPQKKVTESPSEEKKAN